MSDLDQVLEQLRELKTSVNALGTQLGAVETRLGGVETRLGAVESRLEALDTKVDRLATVVEAIAQETLEAPRLEALGLKPDALTEKLKQVGTGSGVGASGVHAMAAKAHGT